MAENAKRTPELTRKVKNCNVPRNKIKSVIFWQKSYRLEWYLIICHYLNLSVHCIRSPDSSYYENWPGPNPISRLCVYRNGTWRPTSGAMRWCGCVREYRFATCFFFFWGGGGGPGTSPRNFSIKKDANGVFWDILADCVFIFFFWRISMFNCHKSADVEGTWNRIFPSKKGWC